MSLLKEMLEMSVIIQWVNVHRDYPSSSSYAKFYLAIAIKASCSVVARFLRSVYQGQIGLFLGNERANSSRC